MRREAALRSVIPNPGRIVWAGLGFHDHVPESGRAVAAHPTVFLCPSASQAADDEDILLPAESSALDFEGELAIVVGKGACSIPAQRAMEHVAGCSCCNDGSACDWQAVATRWAAGNDFPRTGAFGPWLAVIVTGTPRGLGFKRSSPLLLPPGDVVEVEVDRIDLGAQLRLLEGKRCLLLGKPALLHDMFPFPAA